MSVENVSDAPQGFDTAAVERWIGANLSSLVPPLSWERLPGGHSNLTYRITDASGRVAVIRRPPMGELLPMAHDMAREWAIISALAPTPVPVAQPLGFCDDPAVTGARFYVMGHVDGRPMYSGEDVDAMVPEPERRALGWSFIDTLAALHAVDPDAVGLGTLGKRDSYVGRQLRTWYRSWTASVDDARYDDERAHSLQKFLAENLPEQESVRVVHGDFGLHNVLIGPDCRVAAVVDWEISTLGDPLADLAYALNQWAEPGDAVPVRENAPTMRPGFPTRAELAARYADRTGRDLSRLSYYLAFNWWKSACIVHGVYARYLAGKKSTEGVDLAGLKNQFVRYLGLAQQAIG